MGLLNGTTQRAYYQGNNKGNYQFTSLDDIITQFEIAYVGENKIIPKIKRADIAFHAMRALQELSFDTFKSVKAQEIVLPPSLTMVLPQDYVNYTKLSWVDSAGIKHPLYPTNSTSNPLKIEQEDDGSYDFNAYTTATISNADFSGTSVISMSGDPTLQWLRSKIANSPTDTEDITITDQALTFSHGAKNLPDASTGTLSARAYAAYQTINVEDMDYVDLTASGLSAAAEASVKGVGVIRIGFTTYDADGSEWSINKTNPQSDQDIARIKNDKVDLFNVTTSDGNPAYIEFNDGLATASTKTLNNIDLSALAHVNLVITSYVPSVLALMNTLALASVNTLDDIKLFHEGVVNSLQTSENSTTWENYKSNTPSENNNDDYEDDTYWKMNGNRYGLDPQHAQANGSFYIDDRLGKINFSSNISGKTVILDYISDSLGTDAEMQVHKFAEDAMYKCIAHAILSTSTYGQGLVNRLAKEKFAATRKAKLRLSSIKLEELTQILRGKSKQIKH